MHEQSASHHMQCTGFQYCQLYHASCHCRTTDETLCLQSVCHSCIKQVRACRVTTSALLSQTLSRNEWRNNLCLLAMCHPCNQQVDACRVTTSALQSQAGMQSISTMTTLTSRPSGSTLAPTNRLQSFFRPRPCEPDRQRINVTAIRVQQRICCHPRRDCVSVIAIRTQQTICSCSTDCVTETGGIIL